MKFIFGSVIVAMLIGFVVHVDNIPEPAPAYGDLSALIYQLEAPRPHTRLHKFLQNEYICMADNVYHEARGESKVGWKAVVAVVLTRLKDKRWPKTVCDVVYQPWAFSWTMESPRPTVNNPQLWMAIRDKVEQWMDFGFKSPVGNANHYYATYISKPKWAQNMQETSVIGLHAFYTD